jgi:hypothetical protein
MRKSVWILVAILALAGTVVAAFHFVGRLPTAMARLLGDDRAALINATVDFLDDLKFKDFQNAASYHAPDLQDTVDIPFLIQRVFAIKPELLEVLDYEVLYADIDDGGNRARVKTRTRVKALNDGTIKDVEVIYYFSRKVEGAPWYMKLEDSLRSVPAKPGKAN